MSTTVGGIRIVDMPDLGVVTDDSSVVGEHAGSGRFTALALRNYAGGRGIVSVLDLGAKGDGLTDDTTAIQNALNTYTGKATILIPYTGNPYWVRPLTLPSNTDLVIDGELKLISSSTGPVVYMNGSANIKVCGYGTVDGNGTEQAIVGSDAPSAVFVQTCSNVRISDITIRNSLLWNLNVVASTNVRVDKVKMLGGQYANEFAQGCDDCWLTGCYINGPAIDEGFSFYGNVTNSGAIGNIVTNAGSDGFNVLNDGASIPPCKNIVISNNICYNNFLSGIGVDTGMGGVGNHEAIKISGNRVYGNSRGNLAGAAEIAADCVNGLMITDNFVSGGDTPLSTYGIYVGNRTTDASVTGNSIYDVGASGVPGSGIHIFATNIALVSGNTFHDFRPTRYMIGINGSAGAFNVFSNNVFGQLAAGPPMVITPQPDTVFANVVGNQWAIGNGVTNQVGTQLNGAAGQNALVEFAVGGVARWYIGNAGNAETGSNSGSDLIIYSATDAGTLTATPPIAIVRATGGVTFSVAPRLVTLPTNAANDAAAAAAGVQVGGMYRNGSILMIRAA